MKRIVSLLLLLLICISFISISYTEDNFKISQQIITVEDESKIIDIVVPIFEGFIGADKVNDRVFDITKNAIDEANSTSKSLQALKDEIKKSGEPVFSAKVSLDITYDYVIGELLSLQLNIYSYAGGAHGYYQIINITSNISTGEVYEYEDLFKEDTDYHSRITNIILKQIEEEEELYFQDYKEIIASKEGSYDFLIDGDKLVIYFGLYDIAPYSANIRYFVIDSEDIKDILNDEVYNSIKDSNERGSISLNGKDIKSNKAVLQKGDNLLLPLRAIAEALEYKVDWNIQDGAILAREVTRYVKDGVDGAIIIDGTTYVPLGYFRDVLGENVSISVKAPGEIMIRIYNKESKEYYIYDLMKIG